MRPGKSRHPNRGRSLRAPNTFRNSQFFPDMFSKAIPLGGPYNKGSSIFGFILVSPKDLEFGSSCQEEPKVELSRPASLKTRLVHLSAQGLRV